MDIESTKTALDQAKRVSPRQVEYWMARDIQVVLGYRTWEGFEAAIHRAIKACEQSGEEPEKHFRQTSKMIEVGKTAQRPVVDYFMDRYACYLVAMNGDPSISQIATAQTYFAVQTRRQEIADAESMLDRRIEHRQRLTTSVKKLNMAAKAAGVQNFAFFYDAGYKGLYEMGLSDIKKKKGLSNKDDLYDRAGRAELAANDFHKTQTEQKIIREKVQGQTQAQHAHWQVGQEVRATIRKIGGTMPEDMPPEASLAKLASERKAKQKQLKKKA
ncbi:MAG: DNA damage-inducible protein D [Nitrospiraceae bacterium]